MGNSCYSKKVPINEIKDEVIEGHHGSNTGTIIIKSQRNEMKLQSIPNQVNKKRSSIDLRKNINYLGSIINGYASGIGKFDVKGKYQFNGMWSNGKPNGKGTVTYENGMIYEGILVDGKP